MNLGVILSIGDSLTNLAKTGQDKRFIEYYLKPYSKEFDKVYVFSYENENPKGLPSNVTVIPNKYGIHRYLYSTLMPFLNASIVGNCDVLRVFHLLGTIPALISKIFFFKPYIFNYAYDYKKFTLLDKKYFQLILLYLVEPLGVFFADKILAANINIYQKLNKKAVYIPNFVDTKRFRPLRMHKGKTVLSIGRLESQKNFTSLVKAMNKVDSKLIIVGKGVLKNQLIHLAKKQSTNLQILDKVPNKDLPKIYRSATVFVLPSLIEGSPKTLLEAMSCGVSCIGTNVEGIKELIQDGKTGLLTSTNYKDLRKAILKILNSKSLMHELGSGARKFIEQNHESQKLIQKEMSEIKAVIND